MKDLRHSKLYTGWVRHRRMVPVGHVFRYPLFMLYLDLDEIDAFVRQHWYCSKERFNLVSFKRRDFIDPEIENLKAAVLSRVKTECERLAITTPSIQSVRLLTHLRYFNIAFNPVSFYYCFDEHDNLVCVLAEITNTPWGERHAYLLPIGQTCDEVCYSERSAKLHRFDFGKQFHVSPFNPMEMHYNWQLSNPGKKLSVHMENTLLTDDEKHFDATLVMKQESLSKKLASTLIRFPFMTVSVVIGIYWQAFKLWCKRAPFYDHPASGTATSTSELKANSGELR